MHRTAADTLTTREGTIFMRLLHATLRVTLIGSLLLLTGCPPQRFPFEDRWEQILPTGEPPTGLEEAVKSLDPKLAEAAMQSLAEAAAMPRELHFRMDGTFVEKVTINGRSSAAEGRWEFVNRKGEEHQIQMMVGAQPVQADAVLIFPHRDIMVMRHTLNGKETITIWKRVK